MAPDLYPQLIGEAWSSLPAGVRRAHSGGTTRARGRFEVVRGPGLLSRAIGLVARLPPPGPCDVTLEVRRGADGAESWLRTFGDLPMESAQLRDGDRIVERFGALELVLAGAAEGETMVVRCRGAAFRLGGVRIALPRLLAPRVEARIQAGPNPEVLDVRVTTHVAGGGLLVGYWGRLEIQP